MGWRGTIRSLEAAARRAEREAERRRRELLRQQKEAERLGEVERAALEVELDQNYIEVLLSVHKQCSPRWNWEDVQKAKSPEAPTYDDQSEREGRERLDQYKPSLLDKVLRREEKKRQELSEAIENARAGDRKRHEKALAEHEREREEFEELRKLADGILANDLSAFEEAIRKAEPFRDIKAIGGSIELRSSEPWYMEATLKANADDVIPSESKTLLASGRLALKKIPKGRFYELYQDHVCSCVIRIARELFTLLPSLEMTFVHGVTPLLNQETGHMEEQTVVSVAIPRATLDGLNFDLIDCSDSMKNFVHRMNFRKTKGFAACERLRPEDFRPPTNSD